MKRIDCGWKVGTRMVTRKVGILFFCALAFSVLVMEGAGGRSGTGAFLGFMNSFSAAYLSEGEDAKLLNCIAELMDLREVLRLSGSIPMYAMVGDHTETGSVSKCGMLNVVASLSPAVKYVFLKCLIAKGFHLGISRHGHILSKIYSECLDHPVLRRHLADHNLQSSGTVAPVPGPAPASAPVSAPASAPASVPSPRIPVQPPTPTAPPSDPAPGSSPLPDQHSPTLPNGLSPTEADGRTPEFFPIFPDEKQNRKTTIITAAILSSIGTFFLLACALCCYRKCFRRRNGLSYGKDESPLLNLSMSDFSGSSSKSFGSGSSIRMGPLSSKVESARNSHAIVMDYSDGTSLSDIISGYSNAPNVLPVKSATGLGQKVSLPPPPGMPAPTVVATPSPTIVNSPAPAHVPSPPQPTSPPAAPPPPPPPPPPIASSVNKASPAPPPPLPVRKSGPQPPLPPGPRPPPPPGARPPPPPTGHPPKGNSKLKRPSLGANHSANNGAEGDSSASKTKLKPFFWDKVLANPDQSMVWHQIKSGSFKFDEEMIETLFGYNASAKPNGENKKESSSHDSPVQYIQLLDPKKSQNLAISLKALNVKTEDVYNALMEGEELPAELLQTLLRMQPTTDEELKLRLYTGDLLLLGPAEQFLKSLIDIPFVFKRMDVLLFMSSMYEDVTSTKESFATLEEACTELRSNRLFLKLLEAVLKTGNRMNNGTFRGGAQAFKLDTLLKLSDVKGSDGKTTLLHFVVQEIIRSEGVRAARLATESRSTSGLSSYSFNSDDFPNDSPKETEDDYHNLGLQVVSGLSNELESVKKAAGIDIDALISAVASFGHRLVNITEFLNKDMKNLGEDSGFHHSLKCFVEHAEAAITFLLEEEKRVKTLVHKTTDYFHGNAGKDEGLRLFVIVRDFLGMLDKACKEVRESQKKVLNTPKVKSNVNAPSIPDPRHLLFPAIKDRRIDNSSSDEE